MAIETIENTNTIEDATMIKDTNKNVTYTIPDEKKMDNPNTTALSHIELNNRMIEILVPFGNRPNMYKKILIPKSEFKKLLQDLYME